LLSALCKFFSTSTRVPMPYTHANTSPAAQQQQSSVSPSSTASTTPPTSSIPPSMSPSGLHAKLALASLHPPPQRFDLYSARSLVTCLHTTNRLTSTHACGNLAIEAVQATKNTQVFAVSTIFSSRITTQSIITCKLLVVVETAQVEARLV
jgi:hypothetical protein